MSAPDQGRSQAGDDALTNDRPCPDGAALSIRGEHYPCDTMRQMHRKSHNHDGWAHGSRAAEAIWTRDAEATDDARRIS